MEKFLEPWAVARMAGFGGYAGSHGPRISTVQGNP